MTTVQFNISENFPNGLDTTQLLLEVNHANYDNNQLLGTQTSDGTLYMIFENIVGSSTIAYLENTIFPDHEIPDKPIYSDPDVFSNILYLEKAVANASLYRGSVTNTSGLTFRASGLEYIIRTSVYKISNKTITLDDADSTHPRIDIICANELSKLVKVTGTPASDPVEPDTPLNHIKLLSVRVENGATQPAITNTMIYSENVGVPSEWNGVASTARINLNNTLNVHSGSKSIAFTSVIPGDSITFTPLSSVVASDYSNIFLGLYITDPLYIDIMLTVFNNGKEISTVNLTSGIYGFSNDIIGEYQQIVIPMSDFMIQNKFDEIKITVNGENSSVSTFYMDKFCLQSGISYSNNTIVNTTGTVVHNNYSAVTNPSSTDDINSNYGIGSMWVNTIDTSTFQCVDNTASAAVWNKVTGFGNANYFDAYATMAINGITGSFIDIPLNAHRQTSVLFSHTLDTAPVTINESDTYLIISRVTTTSPGNNRITTSSRIQLDTGSGYSTISGSQTYMYNRNSSTGESTGTATVVLSLSAGDKLKLQVGRTGGSVDAGTVANASSLTIMSVKGSIGPIGPQGPAGGAQGPEGGTGPQGAVGNQGAAGSQGPQGAVGEQGAPGGSQGNDGPPGPTGAQGPEGPIGPTGIGGDIGNQTIIGPIAQGLNFPVIHVAPAGQSGFVDENTITAALARVASQGFTRATIHVHPGIYMFETLPLVVPGGVTIKGDKATSVFIVSPVPSAATVFHMRNDSSIEHMHITGFSSPGGTAVFFDSTDNDDYPTLYSGLALASGIRVTNCDTAFKIIPKSSNGTVSMFMLHESIVAASSISPPVTVNNAVSVSGGGRCHMSDFGTREFGNTKVGTGVSVTGTGSQLTMLTVVIRGCETGMYINDGGKLKVDGSPVRFCDTAVHVGPDGTNSIVRCTGVDIESDNGTDILIEPTAADIKFIFGSLNMDKIVNTYNIDYGTVANSEASGDAAIQFATELHVGTPQQPRESVFGGGDSYTQGMVVLRKQIASASTSGTDFDDITEVVRLFDDNTEDLFPNESENCCLYIGGPREFGGIKLMRGEIPAGMLDIDNSRVAVEYYDGSVWREVPRMATNSNTPYDSTVTQMFTDLYDSQQIRFGIRVGTTTSIFDDSFDDWSSLTINGHNKLWVRFRIKTASGLGGNGVPAIKQIKLHIDRYEINSDGYTERFGGVVKKLEWHWSQVSRTALFTSPTDIFLSDNIFVRLENCVFSSSGTNKVGFITELPPGMDTSKGIRFALDCTKSSVSTGNVGWTLYWDLTKQDSPLDLGSSPSDTERSLSFQQAINVGTNVQFEFGPVYLDISEFNTRPLTAEPYKFWFVLQRDNSISGNLFASITAINISGKYIEVFDGAHPQLF